MLGVTGVIYALECARALAEDAETAHLAVDVVSWADEEGWSLIDYIWSPCCVTVSRCAYLTTASLYLAVPHCASTHCLAVFHRVTVCAHCVVVH